MPAVATWRFILLAGGPLCFPCLSGIVEYGVVQVPTSPFPSVGTGVGL